MNKKRKFLMVSVAIFIYSVLVIAISLFSQAFAEMYTRTASSFFRAVLAYTTSVIPFSLAEAIVILLIPSLVSLFIYVVVLIVRGSTKLKGVCLNTLAVVLLMVSVFINVFGVCYFRSPLDENMNIDKSNISDDDIYLAAVYCKNQLELYAERIEFSPNGASINPHSPKEMSKLIDNGYKKLIDEYDFISDINVLPKRIFLSSIMTYTHISGIYMPFTGEANVNTNYPSYVVAHTTGHEKAHQRGISGEDEAGFVSYLALSKSDDDYLTYCALMTMYDHLLSSLAELDIELYYSFMQSTDEKIVGEMKAYHEFFKKYSGSAASNVANTVNDTYIKVMGDDDGTKSYGKVVELFAAYLKENAFI